MTTPHLESPERPLHPLSLVVLALILVFGFSSPSPAEESVSTLVQKGLDLIAKKDLDGAKRLFKKATSLSEGPCGECQLGLAMVYSRSRDLRKGEKSARAAIEQLEGSPRRFLAYGELGRLCLQRAKKRPAAFECAEDAFRKAFEVSGETSKNALFYLGYTLVKSGQDFEGIEVLQRFVDAYPDDVNAATARSLIDEPEELRKSMLPTLDLVTVDGEPIRSRDLEGKVVLLDFWATWCPPCRDAAPALRRLAEKYRDDPFTIIGFSLDSNEAMMRDFIHGEKLSWPQIWDARTQWGMRKLKVSSYPTYVIVGADGEILYRLTGGGDRVEKELERRIAIALRLAERSAS